jgi:hypothetical protein
MKDGPRVLTGNRPGDYDSYIASGFIEAGAENEDTPHESSIFPEKYFVLGPGVKTRPHRGIDPLQREKSLDRAGPRCKRKPAVGLPSEPAVGPQRRAGFPGRYEKFEIPH